MNQLQQHIHNILHKNYQIASDTFILLLHDRQSPLAIILADAYAQEIKSNAHKIINFSDITEEQVFAELALLPTHSLVILVQSESLRTTKHRLRADLFQLGHMVIEHARLSFMKEDQIQHYIDSLAYDTPHYVEATNKIEDLLNTNSHLKVESGNGLLLEVHSAFEEAIKNTGDFSNNPAKSTGFPIGEIFSEAKELDKINGSVEVFAYPADHKTFFAEPFIVTIKDGLVVSHSGPTPFDETIQLIKQQEPVQVREIGFGLNRGIGFEKRLDEPTAFERFAGMHFSLGLKHAMYQNKLGRKLYQKFHVDIFCKVTNVWIGNTPIMKDGKYLV